jgi:hypothetical protein
MLNFERTLSKFLTRFFSHDPRDLKIKLDFRSNKINLPFLYISNQNNLLMIDSISVRYIDKLAEISCDYEIVNYIKVIYRA